MKADEKEVKRKRLEISLNLENKEDREVWNILKKKKNINAYFRQAVLYQAKGQRLDWQTAQDIQETIRTTICELFSSGSVPVGVGTSREEPLPDTMIQDSLTGARAILPDPLNSPEAPVNPAVLKNPVS